MKIVLLFLMVISLFYCNGATQTNVRLKQGIQISPFIQSISLSHILSKSEDGIKLDQGLTLKSCIKSPSGYNCVSEYQLNKVKYYVFHYLNDKGNVESTYERIRYKELDNSYSYYYSNIWFYNQCTVLYVLDSTLCVEHPRFSEIIDTVEIEHYNELYK